MDILDLVKKTHYCKTELAKKTSLEKSVFLKNLSQNILLNKEKILNSNNLDIELAKKNNMLDYMIDRLMLNEQRLFDIASSVKSIAEMDDIIFNKESEHIVNNGMNIVKTIVPLGVVAIIYESRPNVTIDSVALCLKTSNVCILKGGKEAINTNMCFIDIVKKTLEDNDFNKDFVNFINSSDRNKTIELMSYNQYIDVLIPRGGQGLIKSVIENSKIPVIETGTGNCHVYVDIDYDLDMALNIIVNSKTSRVSVCNSCESILIHKGVDKSFLKILIDKLKSLNVSIFACKEIYDDFKPQVHLATEEDYYTEYLDYKISIKLVDNIEMAIEHINHYSSHHSDCIITNNYKNADTFTRFVDSSVVYHNASTRFTDGFEFGFGAEIGISTQKLHVRGPMGLEALTTYKYVVHGDGHIR